MRSRLLPAIAGCVLIGGLAMSAIVSADAAPASPAAIPPARGLSILSYNVEGLPWPVASGRSDAAHAIAERLLALHRQGAGPTVVAVQEAFGSAEKRIGAEAGYRYAAFGPAPDLAGAAAATAADRAFRQHATMWRGETMGHIEDSGLAVFSDYPIVWTRRMAFPTYACAGWDCLANKGALAVAVRVPGSRRPVVIVDTHLNSRIASGVSDARSLYAYRRQVDALGGFVTGVAPVADGFVLAGDFNVGNNAPRSIYLGRTLFATEGLKIAAAESVCGLTCRVLAPPSALGGSAVGGMKSILAYRATLSPALAPQGLVSSFGIAANGHHLSDHIGIARPFGVRA